MEPLLDEPLHAYAPPDQGPTPTGSWGPWVTFPAGSRTRELIEAAVRANGSPFDVVGESHQPEVLREMVRLGMGWTVLPAIQAERSPGALRPVTAEPVAHRTLVTARRVDAVPSPPSDRLIEELHRAVG